MTELLNLEGKLRRTLASLPRHEGVYLIDQLTRPDSGRVELIGRLYRAGVAPSLAELLLDLEKEPARYGS